MPVDNCAGESRSGLHENEIAQDLQVKQNEREARCGWRDFVSNESRTTHMLQTRLGDAKSDTGDGNVTATQR